MGTLLFINLIAGAGLIIANRHNPDGGSSAVKIDD